MIYMNSTRKTGYAPVLRVFQSKDQTRAFYNKISRVYDLLSERSEAPTRKAGLVLLRARAGESVLEIGFGTGHSLVAFAKAVGPKGTVFGLDLSDKMLQRAKISLARFNLLARAQLRCADATQLPYEDNSMDAVFMSFTLELFDTPEIPKVLRECKRVLRPGGRIVVVGMSKENRKRADEAHVDSRGNRSWRQSSVRGRIAVATGAAFAPCDHLCLKPPSAEPPAAALVLELPLQWKRCK